MVDPVARAVDQAARPPSFWRAIGITFEIVVRNVRTCALLVSVYALLNGVASAIGRTVSFNIDPAGASPGELLAISAAAIAGLGTLVIVNIFVYPPTIAALSLVGSAAVFGDALDPNGVVRHTLDRALEAIGAFLLTILILLVAPIAIGIVSLFVGLAVGAEAGFAALLVQMVLVAVPALYVGIRLSLSVPVVVREGLGPVAALRRSWELVKGSWWWVFGIIVVVGIASSMVSSLFSFVFSLGQAGTVFAMRSEPGNFVLAAIGAIAGAAAGTAIVGVATGVLYAARASVLPPAELPLPDATPAGDAPSVESPPESAGDPELHS